MGTNFYSGNYDPKAGHVERDFHIGKRSAAGLFCWDCWKTLCKAGEGGIHQSDKEWFEYCPWCGKKVDRELGFNKQPYGTKTGVRSCSSFSWAEIPCAAKKEIREVGVVDEYGRKFTAKEFEKILDECPIQFVNSVGKEFC
jgi:hypothetical protein